MKVALGIEVVFLFFSTCMVLESKQTQASYTIIRVYQIL